MDGHPRRQGSGRFGTDAQIAIACLSWSSLSSSGAIGGGESSGGPIDGGESSGGAISGYDFGRPHGWTGRWIDVPSGGDMP